MRSSAKRVEEIQVDEDQDALNHRLNYSDIDASHILLRKDTVWLGSTLVLFQALDGFFTSVGISRFGLTVEGNPILRSLMEQFGHVPVLALLKTAAVFLVLVMTILANRQRWIRHAMVGVSCVYFFAAIVPWAYILYIRPAFAL